MGANLAGGGRPRSRRHRDTKADINVTPLVDVMLVLLIIFMVTAPLMTVGVPVDLPKTSKAPQLAQDDKPLIVTIDKQGKVYLQGEKEQIEIDALGAKLQAITAGNTEARILVRGDASVNYGRMLEVMATISGSGYKKVGLVADMSGGSSHR